MFNFQLKLSYLIFLTSCFILLSCGVQQKIAKSAKQVINDSSLLTAHVGISIYEPATGKYWYNYQGDKYFVPASNTKLPTCYAAMKYLGDSVVGAKVLEYRNDLIVLPTGDPTFLNEEFTYQPVIKFLKEKGNSIVVRYGAWTDFRWGNGWSWNDYEEPYMAERSPMPMYGNIVKFFDVNETARSVFGSTDTPIYRAFPNSFSKTEFWNKFRFNINLFSKEYSHDTISKKNDAGIPPQFKAGRDIGTNTFFAKFTYDSQKTQVIPFVTSNSVTNQLLADTLHKPIRNENVYFDGHEQLRIKDFIIIHSQPTDSLLKPMMHRSDNFFAEQSLLMVSNEKLGVMNYAKIIDTLLKTDFKDLPQKPRWVDGSGLSRYNLFTPQDFVAILNKMKNEFGMERIKVILPTGGEGTISSYYKADSTYIFAKTGTLSGVVALSGFLYTKKGKLLIFSTLVNNHQASATAVRRAVEKFIHGLREKY